MKFAAVFAVLIALAYPYATPEAKADTPTPTNPTVSATATRSPTSTPTVQGPNAPLIVRIPIDRLDQLLATGESFATFYARISAIVDGAICDSADLKKDRSAGFVLLQIGLPPQPEKCRRDGATVTFALGQNAEWPMVASFGLKRGATETLDRLGVQPPKTGQGIDQSGDRQPLRQSPGNQPTTASSPLWPVAAALGLIVVGGCLLLRRRIAKH